MTPFFAEQDLTFDHVKAITSAMFAVAKVDGVHDREMSMIREFYEGCTRAGDPSLEDVCGADFDVEAAKPLFESAEMSRMFVKNLILLAFADGTYAKPEDALIRKYAAALGLSDEDVNNLHEATKEFLLASLAHIQNVDALRAVAKRLEITD